MRPMHKGMLVAVALWSFGCGKGGPPAEGPAAVDVTPPAAPSAPPPDAPAEVAIAVKLTAATLADDCGGAPPSSPPSSAPKASVQKGESTREDSPPSKAKRRCEQTSIQLSIVAPADAKAADITIKHVEIFDETGASIGVVRASAPRKWSGERYEDWDQKVAPGAELSVSYALSEPDWTKAKDRYGKTYVIKAVVLVGSADRAVQTDVKVDAMASPPSIVKT